jgi:hypothetical protein
MANIDMAFFPSVEGSMTSEDGHTFMLHVKRPTGSDLLLGFPHTELPRIIENAAIQSTNGRDQDGNKTNAAFLAYSFKLERGPDGDPVLTLVVGRAGSISFLLPADMPGQLTEALQKLAN